MSTGRPQPAVAELLARIEQLEARLVIRGQLDSRAVAKTAGAESKSAAHDCRVTRAGVLKAAALGVAAVAGAGTLLWQETGVAGATASEGKTSFASSTTAPTVTATNRSAASNAYGLKGVIKSKAGGSGSAGVCGQNNSTGSHGIGVLGSQNGSGTGVYGHTRSGYGVYGTSDQGTGVYGFQQV